MPELTKSQQAVIDNRGGALLVSAAAGSGKTFVLVKRLLKMITDENDPASITDFLIITFTKAAAAELRAKITDEIRSQLSMKPGNRHLQNQLNLVHSAKIMTIHSFCSSILRENAHVVDITPDFRQIEDSECEVLKAKALDELLERRYANVENDRDFALLMENLSATYDDKKLCEVVLDAYEKARTHADMEQWMANQLDALYSADHGENQWEAEIISVCQDTIQYWIRRYDDLLDLMSGDQALEMKYMPAFQSDQRAMVQLSAALRLGWDQAAMYSKHEFESLGKLMKYDDVELKEKLQNARKAFKRTWEKVGIMFDASHDEVLSDVQAQLPIVRGLFSLIVDFDECYEKEKRRRGALDFGDLEHYCLRLLLDENGELTETAESISRRFREILVDEYQDTNEIQDKLIFAVSQGGHNVFMVGDVKQSIYRFRLADPTIFLGKYQSFPDSEKAKNMEGRRIILSKNFRSRACVLDAVNDVFENIMSTQFGEMEYGDNEKLSFGADFTKEDDCPVEFSVIDMGLCTDEELERTEAEAAYTATRISQLLETAMVADNATGGLRKAEPKDIAILMRAPGSRADTYIQQLETLGIPSAFSGGKSGLLTTAEAKMLVSLLQIIDNPRQDIPLISTLKSPLFGFSSDKLAEIRVSDTKSDFYTALEKKSETDEMCKSFIEEISELRQLSTQRSSDELIWEVFCRTDILALCSAMEGGELKRKNLLLLYQYAQTFEQNGYRGLFGFVNRLQKLMEQEDSLKGATETADGNVVTITSIHQSKGLEYPIVFVCDLARNFNTKDTQKPVLLHRDLGVGVNIRDVDRMIEYPSIMRRACEQRMKRESLSEELRILYVAMTRAKERLILTASFKNAESALKNAMEAAAAPAEPQLLLTAGCAAKWLLYVFMSRPEGRKLLGYDIGVPDCKSFWKISLVTGQRAMAEAADYEEAFIKESEKVDLAKRFSVPYLHQGSVGLPAKLTASYLKGRYLDSEASDEGHSMYGYSKSSFTRPIFEEEKGLSPTEKGTATHLVMQYIDFDGCNSVDSTKEQIIELFRAEIISSQQLEAVDENAVYGYFDSELGRRMNRSRKLMREFKFSLLTPASMFYKDAGTDELLLQGVIDCCFEENGQLVLVDFKTDKISSGDEAKRAESYKTQMDIYAYALERMTGMEVKERILYFFATAKAYTI